MMSTHKIFSTAFVLAALGLGSCASTSATGTMMVDGKEVEFGADVVSEVEDVDVDATIVAQVDGRVQAQFELENDDDFPVRIHITWDWLDANGIALRKSAGEPAELYEVLAADEKKLITLLSPTERAVKVNVHVRSTKPKM
jgi:uncharacterized protein YcfL